MPDPHDIPRFVQIRQLFPRPQVEDVDATVRAELGRILEGEDLSGKRIGITVGSRGIVNIATLARAAVQFLSSRGAEPFIIPSMGSHGGASSEGQRALIAHYGVTEDSMGCPIRAEMPTISIGETDAGMEVFVAQTAMESDGILLMNRIKPHTDYKGPIESGLTKIAAIGLGKLQGATSYHNRVFDLGLGNALRSATAKILESGKIIGGLGILENAYHETAKLVGVRAETLFEEEEELLTEARGLMGRLPFLELDVLLCDRMGKNISGAGLDTNIIGRSVRGYAQGEAWIEGQPGIQRIFVRSLSEESDGNAVGMGLFEFSTPRFMDQVNLDYTRLNAFTACSPLGARPPITLPTDREAIQTAIRTCLKRPDGPRMTYVKDTLALERVLVSECFLEEARSRDDLEVLGDPEELAFDAEGWLRPPF